MTRKILWTYWAITVTIAMIIGVFTGIVFNFDPRLRRLTGDFIDGNSKIENINDYQTYTIFYLIFFTPSEETFEI